jgi:hypothetical protein
VRPSTAAAAAAAASAAAALSASLTLQPAAGDVAAAAVAAQREALLSQWDAPARKGLAACAEQAVSSGCDSTDSHTERAVGCLS